jgi:acetyl-CoA acetyltransferase family protein
VTDVFIIDAVRTPIGRYGGALRGVRPGELLALVLQELCARTTTPAGEPAAEIEDIVVGCANQAGEAHGNVARSAALLAGLPVASGAQTVNRRCGSGLEAVRTAAHAIQVGETELTIAGGVESMTRAPFVLPKPESGFVRGDLRLRDTSSGWRLLDPRLSEIYPLSSPDEAAENVAQQRGVMRAVQDAFALESHIKAIAAMRTGRFQDEIVPVEVPQSLGPPTTFSADEQPRADITLEMLAQLRPSVRPGGTITTGNSATLNDGAAVILLASAAAVQRLGLRPMARIVSSAVVGLDPAMSGLGAVPATRKAMDRAGLTVEQMTLVELHEAYAAQCLPCVRDLGIAYECLNVNGGGIALGQPLGMAGIRMLCTLVHELRRRGGRFGLVAMGIGIGQGIAMIVEAVR